MDTQFTISTVIPVYNGERYLVEAIQSVLAQTLPPTEIIVVNDGSTDSTAQVAAQFKDEIQYLYQPNAGVATARNAGLRTAQGDFISFLDADDLWSRNKQARQLACLLENPHIGIVMGLTQCLRRVDSAHGESTFERFQSPWFPPSMGSMLIRKGVFEQVGLFDESLRQSEDLDWMMRAREQEIVIQQLQCVVQFYRLHGDNITRNRTLREFSAIKKHLARVRRLTDAAASSPDNTGFDPGTQSVKA